MDINQIVDSYKKNIDQYTNLAKCIAEKLSSELKRNGIVVHSITPRFKGIENFKEKITRPGKHYLSPMKEITDLAGVRVITYFLNDIEKIIRCVNDCFIIDRPNSVDKRHSADPSSFGYSSVHFVVQQNNNEQSDPKIIQLRGLKCEIQIRTILQHAWAEIEHDIVYKTSQDTPFELQRRFASLSGMLELADREFQSLRSERTRVRKDYEKKITKKHHEIPLNYDSLKIYLEKEFNEVIDSDYYFFRLLHFLQKLRINSIHDLGTSWNDGNISIAKTFVSSSKFSDCSTRNSKNCLLKYFIALALKKGLSLDEVYEASGCYFIRKCSEEWEKAKRSVA